MKVKYVKFDTIVLMIPSNCFEVLYELSTNNFNITTNMNKQITSYTLKENRMGLNKLIYIQNDSLPADSKIEITISSKILLDRYPELIHKDNFHTVVENINKFGIIALNYNDVIKYAQVYRIDCTSDISVVDKQSLISYLKSLPCTKNYSKKDYPTGIEILSSTRSKNDRIIFYDKETEMHIQNNKDFVALLSQTTIDYFKDKIRIETNLREFKQIREYLEVDTTYLKEILESKANPLFQVFGKIFKTSDKIPFVCELRKYELEKIRGRISLLDEFNNKIEKIYDYFVALGYKINKKNHYMEYQEAFDFNNRINDCDLNYIDKIKDLLSA